jgi:hypothetical protein
VRDVLWVLYCMATYFLLESQQIFVFHIRSKLSPDNMSNSSKSSSNFMQFFFCIHCFFVFFFCMLDLSVSSPSSLSPLEWLSAKIKWVTTKLTGCLNTWIWKWLLRRLPHLFPLNIPRLSLNVRISKRGQDPIWYAVCSLK